MKRFHRFVIIVTVAIFVMNFSCFSQVYGKLFTSKVANQKYGAVVDSVKFSVKDFQMLLKETDKYAMFKIVNNSVIILGDGRKVLYPGSVKVEPEDVFILYSKSVIEDLISVGDADSIYFEQRKEVFSVTVGNVTMEIGVFCPPFCH